jgi:predicted site-specific integrase-resolvase
MNEKDFISIGKASVITGLTSQTLRKLCDTQKITCYKTPSGQRKFNKLSLETFCNPISNSTIVIQDSKIQKIQKQNYIYTRVSSKKQMDDLLRQVTYVKSRREEYSSYISLSDIGSGINFKRKGLSTILDACLQGLIGEIVIAHRDRLSRFGFDLIELLVSKSGGKIIVLDDQHNKSTEQELAEDLLSIVHIYSCRQMGKRSYKSKQPINKSIEDKIKTITLST